MIAQAAQLEQCEAVVPVKSYLAPIPGVPFDCAISDRTHIVLEGKINGSQVDLADLTPKETLEVAKMVKHAGLWAVQIMKDEQGHLYLHDLEQRNCENPDTFFWEGVMDERHAMLQGQRSFEECGMFGLEQLLDNAINSAEQLSVLREFIRTDADLQHYHCYERLQKKAGLLN